MLSGQFVERMRQRENCQLEGLAGGLEGEGEVVVVVVVVVMIVGG